MKKLFAIIFFLIAIFTEGLHSQTNQDTTFYLVTCAPGTETYSIYGHSAIRVLIQHLNSDTVYNWGVFDFNTPNFVWKFAKGRLNYLLDSCEFQRFIPEYYYEKRSVYIQRINIEPAEKKVLLSLIHENRLPQNRYYRYDFFYDDCSTRIRDLIEKAVGAKLTYPPDTQSEKRTFRSMVGEYQRLYPWLKMGVDLIMGTPGEVKANFRDRMFLPLYLQKNLSQAVINHDDKMIPLLNNPETILQFDPPEVNSRFYTAPIFVFSLLFIALIMLSALYKKGKLMNVLDIILFGLFSVLSVLMIFFNFFTDHQQMKLNLNIIWFNPVIIICFFYLILKKIGEIWFRIVFYLSIIFIPMIIILPYAINNSFVPVLLILMLRSSVRGRFSWNPLFVPE
jgi:hypothetical protein